MHKKHYRSTTISQYKDFGIRPDDQKKIDENIEVISTEESPLSETNDKTCFFENFQETIEFIKENYSQLLICINEKKKYLKNKILEEFFKEPSLLKKTKKKKFKKNYSMKNKNKKEIVNNLSSQEKKKLKYSKDKSKIKHFKSMDFVKITSKTNRYEFGSKDLDEKMNH